MTQQAEQHAFQAEVSEVLSIVVNSLYSHKEIFLRELISNASDAIDKLAFKALTDHQLTGDDSEYQIDLIPSKDAGTLTIRDNGVGMTREELTENLGTIAKSGTKQLMQSLEGDEKKDLNLIGKFGVGFYSAFLVADEVTVTSRAAGSDEAWMWVSNGKTGFTLESSEREARGTNIILRLKDDMQNFLEEYELRSLVRKYSDYVRIPIRLQVERDEPIGEEKDDDGNPKTESVKKWEVVNTASALWTRPKSEITDEQYSEFYKHMTHDWADPLAHTHFKVEGSQEMTGMMFVPSQPPLEMFQGQSGKGVRLYVKRVFIMEDCEDILPEWLRFMRGVVDSEDLPLNVSREILQQERVTAAIKKQVVNKTLNLFEELADEGETTKTTTTEVDGEEKTEETKVNRYEQLWNNFGKILKEGVHYDHANKDRIAKLLRYPSSKVDGIASLTEYVERMPEDQDSIYYIVAETLDTARHSPHIEALAKRGYEVLFMTDAVDEWVVNGLGKFDDKELVSAAKGNLDFSDSDEEKKEMEAQSTLFSSLTEQIQENLGEYVQEVRVTNRLTDSPACLVSDEHGMSPYIEKVLRANGQDVPTQKRILELNPEHDVVKSLQELAKDEGKSEEVHQWSQLLFDQALVAEGSLPADPAQFARTISQLMKKAVD
ncbi:MAG: molecular chaperone HtpG [Planctomycetota bacterium]|nr:molecular chaperone HtpG [Planctomycetota bacterium]